MRESDTERLTYPGSTGAVEAYLARPRRRPP